MAQFRVYRNPRPETKGRFPLLLDVQSDLIEALETRVVIPLGPAATLQSRQITTLMPTVVIEGKPFTLCTPQLAGVPRSSMGAEVADLSAHRGQIIAALDLLVTGF